MGLPPLNLTLNVPYATGTSVYFLANSNFSLAFYFGALLKRVCYIAPGRVLRHTVEGECAVPGRDPCILARLQRLAIDLVGESPA